MLKQERFFPAGTYTWSVPAGCESVDVFLVGGGGAGRSNGTGGGAGGGYTKTFKKDTSGWRDGDSISVYAGQSIQITVGRGATKGSGAAGGYSRFMNSSYQANGGNSVSTSSLDSHYMGGNGGSGGSADTNNVSGSQLNYAGSDGGSGNTVVSNIGVALRGGTGQGHTTRDFGEPTGKRNAGGGDGRRCDYSKGVSDYTEGKGEDCSSSGLNGQYGTGGGGYGGGGGAGGNGGDGTVLIRYYAYE